MEAEPDPLRWIVLREGPEALNGVALLLPESMDMLNVHLAGEATGIRYHQSGNFEVFPGMRREYFDSDEEPIELFGPVVEFPLHHELDPDDPTT